MAHSHLSLICLPLLLLLVQLVFHWLLSYFSVAMLAVGLVSSVVTFGSTVASLVVAVAFSVESNETKLENEVN